MLGIGDMKQQGCNPAAAKKKYISMKNLGETPLVRSPRHNFSQRLYITSERPTYLAITFVPVRHPSYQQKIIRRVRLLVIHR